MIKLYIFTGHLCRSLSGTSCAEWAKEDKERLLVGNEDIASTNRNNGKSNKKSKNNNKNSKLIIKIVKY